MPIYKKRKRCSELHANNRMLERAGSVEEFVQQLKHMSEAAEKLQTEKEGVVTMGEFDNDPLPQYLLEEAEDETLSEASAPSSPKSLEWLSTKCKEYTEQKQAESMFTADELQSTILATLKSDASDEELQGNFAEMLGFDHLDLVIELIQRRNELVEVSEEPAVVNVCEKCLFQGKCAILPALPLIREANPRGVRNQLV